MRASPATPWPCKYAAITESRCGGKRQVSVFAPDLAVEVVSPDQKPDEMAAKARLYLAGGTRLVWVVWPSSGHIDVWRSGHTDGPVVTLNTRDSLNGEDVAPGFTYPVVSIFEALTPPQ